MDLRQLLSQGYQAADRFLPFDGVLDPMFAPPPRRQMPQDVGAMPNTQSRFAPQQAAPMPQQAVPQLAMPQPASNPFAMPVPKKGGGFGRTIMEFVDPSFNRRADERSAAIAGRERQAQLFATIYPIIKDDPREVAALMLNPEEYGKNLAERYGADVVNQGDLLTFGGKPQTYNPATYQSGDQLFQTKQGGGFTDPVRRAPSFDETTARQRLEFDMSKPQIVTTSPGQDVVAVNPNAPGAIPLTGMSVATAELLAATNYQESRGRRDAISPKGAAGPMQVMPGTARDLARRFGQNFDGLTDEQIQTRMMAGPEPGQTTSLGERMGEAYMNDQLKAFGGNVPLALAAYNAGPGKAAEWAKAYGRPGENVSLADWVAKIPFGETRDYISKILGGNAGPSAQVVASGGAKPQYRPATAKEKADFGLRPDQPAQVGPDGKVEAIQTAATKPLPVGIQKAEDDDYVAIDGHQVIADQLGGFINQLQSGALNLGPVSNRVAAARTFMGRANAEDANYNSFVSGMKKMRDDSLALNNGTQTEGDAIRAWEQLFANMNDERVVAQRLREIQSVNARAVKFRQQQIDRRRVRNGAEPVFGTAPATTPAAPPPIKPPPKKPPPATNNALAAGGKPLTREEVAKLPKGTRFKGIDGKEYVR